MPAIIGLYVILVGILAVILIVLLVIIIKTVVTIIDRQDINNNSKLFWIILILATNIVGLIVYAITSNKNVFD